jgi:hypothetical protein
VVLSDINLVVTSRGLAWDINAHSVVGVRGNREAIDDGSRGLIIRVIENNSDGLDTRRNLNVSSDGGIGFNVRSTCIKSDVYLTV